MGRATPPANMADSTVTVRPGNVGRRAVPAVAQRDRGGQGAGRAGRPVEAPDLGPHLAGEVVEGQAVAGPGDHREFVHVGADAVARLRSPGGHVDEDGGGLGAVPEQQGVDPASSASNVVTPAASATAAAAVSTASSPAIWSPSPNRPARRWPGRLKSTAGTSIGVPGRGSKGSGSQGGPDVGVVAGEVVDENVLGQPVEDQMVGHEQQQVAARPGGREREARERAVLQVEGPGGPPARRARASPRRRP